MTDGGCGVAFFKQTNSSGIVGIIGIITNIFHLFEHPTMQVLFKPYNVPFARGQRYSNTRGTVMLAKQYINALATLERTPYFP